MRKLLFILGIVLLAMGCQKNESSTPMATNIPVSISKNTDSAFFVGLYGDEDAAMIIQQPSHFKISEIQRSGDTVIYRYTPPAGYTGNDEVLIKSQRGATGISDQPQTKYFRLLISVN